MGSQNIEGKTAHVNVEAQASKEDQHTALVLLGRQHGSLNPGLTSIDVLAGHIEKAVANRTNLVPSENELKKDMAAAFNAFKTYGAKELLGDLNAKLEENGLAISGNDYPTGKNAYQYDLSLVRVNKNLQETALLDNFSIRFDETGKKN